ncbi:hypothetical protein ACP70R_041991 [Stipagrostis hirtigluma subsp. patula]
MARSDRRRGGRPGGSMAAAAAGLSSSSYRPASREFAIVQTIAEKMCDPPVTATSAIMVPQGWADLPGDLLQSIIVLLRSPHEALAFAATCRPWHAAIFTSLSTFNFFALFPPFLLQPKLPVNSLSPESFVDLMNPAAPLRCQLPWGTVNKMDYIGYSYGNLIFSHKKKYHLFDAFTGTRTNSPRLIIDKCEYPIFGVLTSPLASPDSSLLVQAGCSMYQWKVGSESWLRLDLFDHDVPIFQVANFKGEIFAMDSYGHLFTVRFKPRFIMQSLDVLWGHDLLIPRCLVVCDDMLLLVGHWDYCFHVVRLDLSSSPKWVKVERLENWAVFLATEGKSQSFACKHPERWGGRSNCIYLCGSNGHWYTFQLGETVKPSDCLETRFFNNLWCPEEQSVDVLPIWVFPGVFYRSRQ